MLDRATGSERGRLQKAGRALHNLSDKPSQGRGDSGALAKNPGRKAKKQTNRRTCRESVAHRDPKRGRATHQPQGLIQQVAAILPCRLADVAQPARNGALARGFDARRTGARFRARARSPDCRIPFRAEDAGAWRRCDMDAFDAPRIGFSARWWTAPSKRQAADGGRFRVFDLAPRPWHAALGHGMPDVDVRVASPNALSSMRGAPPAGRACRCSFAPSARAAHVCRTHSEDASYNFV